MIDPSTFTLDTTIKIKIMVPGIYIPELKTYTPLECFASIEKIISMLNRGIVVDFPQQKHREISEKIEEILLDYNERQEKLRKQHGYIGTNVEKAIDTIQEINDSKITREEEVSDQERRIFDYSDVTNRVIRNLRDTDNAKLINDAFGDPNEDKLMAAEAERKARERIAARRKEALEMATLKAETWQKLANNGKFDIDDDMIDENDYFDTSNDTKAITNNPFFRKK
jgi:hypothetical protein